MTALVPMKPPSVPEEKRLTTAEFIEFAPHLEAHEAFMVEFRVKKEWKYMFLFSRQHYVACNVCRKKLLGPAFMFHIYAPRHIAHLKKVDQLYHPVYTYAKESTKLARGETVLSSELKQAIVVAKSCLSRKTEQDFQKTKSFVEELSRPSAKAEKRLITLALQATITDPKQMVVEAFLPLNCLATIQYCMKEGEWKEMLTSFTPDWYTKGKFRCNICSKFCAGILTVDAHLMGTQHKTEQLKTLAVRMHPYKNLTKNCCFRWGEKYALSAIWGTTRKYFQDQLNCLTANEQLQYDDDDDDDGNADVPNNYEAVKEEPLTDDEEPVTEKPKVEEKKKKTDKTKPTLSAVIAERATALALCIPNSRSVIPRYKQILNRPTNPPTSNMIAHYNPNNTKSNNASSIANEHRIDQDPITDDVSQKEIDGLIGVEYVVRIINPDSDPSPTFECMLCEVGMNEIRMQNHLISYNHRLKYCEQNYPDTLNRYKKQMGNLKYYDYFRVMGPILAQLAWAIEEHHGRALPFMLPAAKMLHQRQQVSARVIGGMHACQDHGPSFANLISKEEIAKFIAHKDSYKTPMAPEDPARMFTTMSKSKPYLNLRITDTTLRLEDRSKKVASASRVHMTQNRRARSPPPPSSRSAVVRPPSSLSRLDPAVAAVEAEYKKYRESPENHPLYDSEWNKFWRRRKEEVRAMGLDHRTHNYQPDWVQFFRSRLEELYKTDLQEAKSSHTNITPPPPAPTSREMKSSGTMLALPMQPYRGPQSSYNSSDRGYDNGQSSHKTNWNAHWDEPASKASMQRLDQESADLSQAIVPYTPLQQWNSSVSGGNDNPNASHRSSQHSPIVNDKANVIHALRLLVAFEDHLGSLGVKVLDLLSQALVLEKSCPNTTELEMKVLTPSNCTLLETAMEKLKGIVFAGLLENHKVQGFNRVINNTNELLKHANKMGWRNAPRSPPQAYAEKRGQPRDDSGQSKKPRFNSPANNKSLSDTLMDLMAGRNSTTPMFSNNVVAKAYPSSSQSRYNPPMSSSSNMRDDFSYNQPLVRSTNLAVSHNRRFNTQDLSMIGISSFDTRLSTIGMGTGRNNYNSSQNANNNSNKNNNPQMRTSNFGSKKMDYGSGSASGFSSNAGRMIQYSTNSNHNARKTSTQSSNNNASSSGNWRGCQNPEPW